jgi:tetratricopeptide (TPR) repeat protein
MLATLSCLGSWANSINHIDSLKQLEKSAPHDSIRIKILSEIAIAYSDSSYAKSINTWKEALAIANKLRDRQQMGDIHHQIGYILYQQGEFKNALQEYNNALSVYNYISNKQEVARVYNDIGLVYKTWGRYELAIESFIKGLELFEEIPDEEGMAMVSNNIGQIHFFREDYNKAISYFNTYLTINEQNKRPRAVAGASNNIAAAYMELKNYNQALSYYNKSLSIYDSLDLTIGVAILSDNIGMLHTNKNNFKEALKHHFKALKLFNSLNSQSRISYTLKNIGVAYYMLGDYNNSDKYLLQAKDLAIHYQQKETEKEIYYNLCNVYEAKKQPAKALKYYKLMTAIKDSLFTAETTKNIASIELQYEAEKKEREFRYIQQKLEQQKMFRVITGSIIIIILALMVLLIIDNNRKRVLISKLYQRKLFLMQTLEHCIENRLGQHEPGESLPILTTILPKTVGSQPECQLAIYNSPELKIIITLWSQVPEVPLTIIKAFLLNELPKNHNNNNPKQPKDLIELIQSKLLFTMDLFDIKPHDILHTVLVVDCENRKVVFGSKADKLWVCKSSGTELIHPNSAISVDSLKNSEPLLYAITSSNHQNAKAFEEHLFKTTTTVSVNNMQSKLEVINSALETWNLSELPSKQFIYLAVSIDCDLPISIANVGKLS